MCLRCRIGGSLSGLSVLYVAPVTIHFYALKQINLSKFQAKREALFARTIGRKRFEIFACKRANLVAASWQALCLGYTANNLFHFCLTLLEGMLKFGYSSMKGLNFGLSCIATQSPVIWQAFRQLPREM